MGDKLVIRYAGMLDDGTVFASSNGKAQKVTLGMRMMWGTGSDIGLVSMKTGERAMITCESDFAYGEAGVKAVNIPPGARLTFDVELIRIDRRDEFAEFKLQLFGLICFMIFVFSMLWYHGHMGKR